MGGDGTWGLIDHDADDNGGDDDDDAFVLAAYSYVARSLAQAWQFTCAWMHSRFMMQFFLIFDSCFFSTGASQRQGVCSSY